MAKKKLRPREPPHEEGCLSLAGPAAPSKYGRGSHQRQAPLRRGRARFGCVGAQGSERRALSPALVTPGGQDPEGHWSQQTPRLNGVADMVYKHNTNTNVYIHARALTMKPKLRNPTSMRVSLSTDISPNTERIVSYES